VALRSTRTGIFIRAIADDVEASRVVGIPLTRMGSGVYIFSGAIAGLAGALLASSVGTALPNILFIFLRALIVAVLGGLTSLPLALAGCLLLGVAETILTAGVFGLVANDQREMIVMGLIFGLVFVINRFRPIRVLEATGF
jgi:branched-subunit amino acid ABC-type transport system permease component